MHPFSSFACLLVGWLDVNVSAVSSLTRSIVKCSLNSLRAVEPWPHLIPYLTARNYECNINVYARAGIKQRCQCMIMHPARSPLSVSCFQVVSRDANSLLAAHYRLDCHPHINSLHEVLLGDKLMYLVFPPSHGDLHSHVRHRKRLREPEARRLFRQMAETVRACHDQGIVLRDLKLRKFVFADPQR